MTDIHIDANKPWKTQIEQYVGSRRITITSRPNGGSEFELTLKMADRVIFHTTHKKDFSQRLSNVAGEPADIWTFKSDLGECFYIGFATSGTSRSPRYMPSNLDFTGSTVNVANYASKKLQKHSLIISNTINRTIATKQISQSGKEIGLGSTLHVTRYEHNYAYKAAQISNRALSDLAQTWYDKRSKSYSTGGLYGAFCDSISASFG